MDDTSALEVAGLNKSFGSIEALKNLQLAIEPGCFFGLLGPIGDDADPGCYYALLFSADGHCHLAF